MQTLNFYNINISNPLPLEKKLENFYNIEKFDFDLENIKVFHDINSILDYLCKVIPENTIFSFDVLEINNSFLVDFRFKILSNNYSDGDNCSWHNFIIHNNNNTKYIFKDTTQGILYNKNDTRNNGFEDVFIPEEYIESFENNLFCTLSELDKVGFKNKVNASFKNINNFINDIYFKKI